MPLTVSCFSKIQIGFTFLVLAHPGSPGKRAVKWVCVYYSYNDKVDSMHQHLTVDRHGPADAIATHCLVASVKSKLVLPFWYRLTWVVPDKGLLNVCSSTLF